MNAIMTIGDTMENTTNEIHLTPQRNYTMDMLKAIFAFAVILVHFPYPGTIGTIFSTIGVSGVIFFFLISGYYAYDEDDSKASSNIMRRFKRNLIITLTVILIYALFTIIESLISGEFNGFIDNFKNPWLFPRILLLGDFSFIHCDAIWFMNNLLISYLVLYLLHKFKITKYAYYILPILILARIGVEIYVNTYDKDWHLTSFFLTSGLPIMLLGHFIGSHKNLFLKSSIKLDIILFILSVILTFTFVFVRVWDFEISQIFKIWCMFELFIITLKIPGKRNYPVIGTIGNKYSMYIYLFHLLIGWLILDVSYLLSSPKWMYDYIIPTLVLIFGTLISIGLYELVHLIKRKTQEKCIA